MIKKKLRNWEKYSLEPIKESELSGKVKIFRDDTNSGELYPEEEEVIGKYLKDIKIELRDFLLILDLTKFIRDFDKADEICDILNNLELEDWFVMSPDEE